MMNERTRGITYFLLITAAIALPVLTEFFISPETSAAKLPGIPYQLGDFHGYDVTVQPYVKESYAQKNAQFIFRKYAQTDAIPVNAIVEQAANLECLHDLYRCLEMNDCQPKRVRVSRAMALPPGATLVECKLGDRLHYALFCYQTKAGTAAYPPRGPVEQAQMYLLARRPCRLIELSTAADKDQSAAEDRLGKLAKLMCAQPL